MRLIVSAALLIGYAIPSMAAGPAIDIKAFAAPVINDPRVRTPHPASCAGKCGCLKLGQALEGEHVETNYRRELVNDWRTQDGMSEAPDVKAIGAVVKSLGRAAGKLSDQCKSLSGVAVSDPRWAALYVAACEKRREIRLKPYARQLKQIVFTKHFDMGGTHYAYTEGLSDAQHEHHFVPGSALCMLEMDGIHGKFTVLAKDAGGVLRDPDVSHDATRLVFAWKKSHKADDYHLYEMDLKTRKVRQLTSGLGYADYEPIYTPDGNFVFSSSRCIQSVDCWHTEVSNLFTCDGDGKYIRRIGFDQVHTTLPTMSHDGRVLYTRWDYNDRGQMAIQSLFQMNPDGTNQRELYGNNSCYPTTILHTRSIRGTGKYVCIVSGHHTRQKGWLAIIDPRLGRQEAKGVQLIAPVRPTLAQTEDQACQTGDQFQYPYPLSETAVVTGLRPFGRRRFGIYFVLADGRRELLYRDNDISCNQPVLVEPRAIPRRASRVDYSKKTGTVYLHDIYVGPGLKGVKRGAIKQLRVVALEFRPCSGKGIMKSAPPRPKRDKKNKKAKKDKKPTVSLGARNRGPISAGLVSVPIATGGGTWDVKTVLGNATVHQDGSACFEAPARKAIFFQALDAKGQMVQSMRSWMTLQPGESVSCIGCHERKNEAPPVPYFSKALAAGAETLDRKPLVGPAVGFDFRREIQPILDKHCVKCHKLAKDQKAPAGKKEAFSLSWPASYNALADRKVCNWINAQSKPPMLPPYYTGSAQSKLIKMLEGGKHTIFTPDKFGSTERIKITIDGPKHNKTNLSDTEMRKLATWIDIGVPCLGDYPVPKDNYYRKKREKWDVQEAENIRQYLARETVGSKRKQN